MNRTDFARLAVVPFLVATVACSQSIEEDASTTVGETASALSVVDDATEAPRALAFETSAPTTACVEAATYSRTCATLVFQAQRCLARCEGASDVSVCEALARKFACRDAFDQADACAAQAGSVSAEALLSVCAGIDQAPNLRRPLPVGALYDERTPGIGGR